MFPLHVVSMDWGFKRPPIVHLPPPCVTLSGVLDLLLFMCPLHVFLWMGFGPPMVHVPSPCVSMDAALGPPIVHLLFPCISMDGV